MNRVLLAWELGSGAGHLATLRPIAEGLLARGHEVTVAVRDIGSAGMVFSGSPPQIRIVQAPFCAKTYSGLVDPPLSFAEILMRFGYLDVPMLKALMRGWRSLLDLTGADRLVVDHAPTALLAARGLGIVCSTFGNSFSVPPAVSPTPNMRDWLDVPAKRLQDSEARVVSAVNAALAPDVPQLSHLYQVFEGTDQMFVGIPELDPYGPRAADNYVGLHGGRSGSEPALWPEGEGPRIFAYIRADYPHVHACLAALAATPARFLINLAGGTSQLIDPYRSPRLAFSAGHVDMDHALSQCDLLICQSGLGTVNAALRGGKPLLLLPAQLEQFLLARNVQKLGVGLAVHPETKTPDIAGSLARLLADPVFAQKAQAVAQRFGAIPGTTVVDRVVARIEACSAAQGA